MTVALVAARTRLDFPLTRDEIWHWPVAVLFGRGLPSLELLACYASGPGPLPYVIWGNLHSLGAGLPLLRLTSLLFTVLALAAAVRLARDLRAPSASALVWFLCLQPYFLTNSVLLMTDPLSLAAALWGLCLALNAIRSGQTRHWAGAGLSMVAGLYARIPLLAMPLGLALSAAWDRVGRRQRLTVAGLTVAAVLPLLAFWGGITPIPHQFAHRVALEFSQVNQMLALLGFLFWPYLFTQPKPGPTGPRWLWALPGLAAVCLAAGFVPAQRAAVMGVVQHLVWATGRLGPAWAPLVVLGVLWVLGTLSATLIALRSWPSPQRRLIFLTALCSMGVPLLSFGGWSERHGLPLYALLGSLAWTEPMGRKWPAYVWFSLVSLLALAHLWHSVMLLG